MMFPASAAPAIRALRFLSRTPLLTVSSARPQILRCTSPPSTRTVFFRLPGLGLLAKHKYPTQQNKNKRIEYQGRAEGNVDAEGNQLKDKRFMRDRFREKDKDKTKIPNTPLPDRKKVEEELSLLVEKYKPIRKYLEETPNPGLRHLYAVNAPVWKRTYKYTAFRRMAGKAIASDVAKTVLKSVHAEAVGKAWRKDVMRIRAETRECFSQALELGLLKNAPMEGKVKVGYDGVVPEKVIKRVHTRERKDYLKKKSRFDRKEYARYKDAEERGAWYERQQYQRPEPEPRAL